jgi:hypothetical protein
MAMRVLRVNIASCRAGQPLSIVGCVIQTCQQNSIFDVEESFGAHDVAISCELRVTAGSNNSDLDGWGKPST